MRIILSLTLIFLHSGCSRTLTRSELVEYIFDIENGLFREFDENGLTWRSYFLPNDILIKNESERKSYKGNFKELEKKYEKILHFVVAVSYKGQELSIANAPDKNIDVLNELLKNIHNSLYIETSDGKDITPISVYVPATFGMASETKFTLSFESEHILKSDWIKLLASNSEIGTGIQIFKYDIKDIVNIPRMKFKEL